VSLPVRISFSRGKRHAQVHAVRSAVVGFSGEETNAEIARKIYDLRSEAGLSQRALAKLVGTTASVICRLEDSDYEGHSLAMLRRIAEALNKRVEIRFVQARKRA
jgi:DNA-binding XRE family transcriptional regulator